MKIGICIKKVPDTETRVKIAPDGRQVSLEGVSFIIAPYDEFAIEEALKLKEKSGQGEVILISVGDAETEKVLRQALAMGADRAILVNDPLIHAVEPFDVARVLAAVARKEGIQLLFFGKQGVGQDYHQVPTLTAEVLGWPAATVAVRLEVAADGLVAGREIEGGEEVVRLPLPAVVSAQKGLNTPRYASLKGIMAAKKKTIETHTLAGLGLSPQAERSWEVVRLEMPPARPAGRLIEGEPEDQVKKLVELLHTEAKVI